MRGLPWNGRAENLKATILTQQDQSPSGHRRVYLGMVQRTAAVAVSVWDHTQKPVECDWKKHWPMREQILSKRRLDRFLSLPPSPKNQHQRHSKSVFIIGSCFADATQNFQNDHMDSPIELRPQERRERKGTRPSETPTGEISGRPVVKARPASPPMIVPKAEGSGTVVLSTPASSSKDEMTIGGLYMIDGIDVVATLVPEKDVWQYEATETCTTETQMQDGEQESIAVVDCEDPSATEALRLTTREQVKSSIQKKCERDEPKRCENLMNSKPKMEVDKSEMRSTPGEKIWSKWVETRKDPNSSAIRCR